MAKFKDVFEKVKVILFFSCLSIVFFFSVVALRYTIVNSHIKEIKILSPLHRVTNDEITSTLDINPSSTIFGYDVNKAKNELDKIPFIRSAKIKRRFPNTINVYINEKKVIAIFEEAGNFYPLDEKGEIILEPIATLDDNDFIIVSGYGAPKKFLEIFYKIKNNPSLYSNIAQIERVEDRRFNITLDDGKIIMLPSNNAISALDKVISLHNKQDLLNKSFKKLD
ncbi:MAG: FtsQ-type POTRA domain-containing protein, partial [Rickettsiales bacterium]|nr:FtsQ-type POTRA domain-containing protein [Rickettsiales bacterium]